MYNNIGENDDNKEVSAFLDEDSQDSNLDAQLNEAAIIANNTYKIERMNMRLDQMFDNTQRWDCINHLRTVLA